MKYAIAELVQMVGEERGYKARIAKLQEFSSPYMKTLLDYTFNPSIEWLVPHNIKYKPCDDNLNTLRTRLYSEIQRLPYFLNIGPYPNLNKDKREALFQTMLETIHPMDAELLIHIIRYRSFPKNKISLEIASEAFPLMAAKGKWTKIKKNESAPE